MLAKEQHSWNVSPKEAVQIQKELRNKVILEDEYPQIRSVAGVDVSVPSGSAIGRSAIVILSFPELELIEVRRSTRELEFPYIPGLLSFREVPVILDAFALIQNTPDMIIVDGQGIAHPRGLGIAAHIGILLDAAAIGCAKSHLYGSYAEPGARRGESSPVYDKSGKQIGTVLRTRTGIKPVFISPGNKVSIQSSSAIVMACTPKFRLPEPIRYAHRFAGDDSMH